MKIRTDFVTNSSSANYILELKLSGENGKTADFDLAVSPETCFSDDGDMTADGISLIPRVENGDICFGTHAFSEAKSIEELGEMLFSAAQIDGWYGAVKDPNGDLLRSLLARDTAEKPANEDGFFTGKTLAVVGELTFVEDLEFLAERIAEHGGTLADAVTDETDYIICNDEDYSAGDIPVLSEFEMLAHLADEDEDEDMDDEDDYDEDEEDEDYDDEGMMVSVRDVAPKTIAHFLRSCKKYGIAPDTLKTIVIRNSKSGSGDSAMWIECDDLLSTFEEEYEQQGEGRNPDKLQALIDFVKSDPVLPANDNEYCLSGEEPCVWETGERKLAQQMEKLLDGELSGDHWMCTLSDEYVIDVRSRTLKNREVLYYGSL